MIAGEHNDDPEREAIQNILNTISERIEVAKQLSAAQLRDERFIQERFAEMAEDLEQAHSMIQRLTEMVRALTADSPPLEVSHALRSRGGNAQPVRMRVGGTIRTFLVPALGMDDPVAQANWWRRFMGQYGGECS